jgi:hypothetical protein
MSIPPDCDLLILIDRHQRMAAVQVDGRQILRRRIELEVRIEPIARLEYELLPRLYTGDWP